MNQPPRVALDTNLVLSALVFAQGRLAVLRHAWQGARFVPLVSKTTTAELIRVLAYPKFKLDADQQSELLADYLPWCETVRIPSPPPATPACRDVYDQPFSAARRCRTGRLPGQRRPGFAQPLRPDCLPHRQRRNLPEDSQVMTTHGIVGMHWNSIITYGFLLTAAR
jgi:hypothetical protein